MITPAYSPTATERVLPRLALDFTTGTLDPRVTVTRALNTATRVNSSGLIAGVNADLPRFDYDPVTLAPKGLLIEETRANVCIRSAEFNTGWSANAVAVVADNTTSPSGNVDADRVTASAGSAQHRLLGTSATVTSNASLTHSVFIKANGHSFFQIHDGAMGTFYANFDVSTGVVTASNPVGGASITPFGNGWYRCVLTFTTGVTNSIGVVAIIPDGTAARNPTWTATGTESIFAWGYQIETGAFATSYIPTTTTSITRNADVVTMTGTNFSDWFNASEGTLSFEGSIFVDQGATTVDFIQVSNGVSNSISIDLAMFGVNGPAFQVINSGTQCNIDTGTLTVNTVFKMVGAYKENAFVAAMNGQSPGVDNSGTIPSGLVKMGIGNRLGGPLMNGHARKIAYWPQRLINAETQAFSKG